MSETEPFVVNLPKNLVAYVKAVMPNPEKYLVDLIIWGLESDLDEQELIVASIRETYSLDFPEKKHEEHQEQGENPS